MKSIDYHARIKKVREKMLSKNLDALFITPSINFGYLFKAFIGLSERLITAVVLPDNELLLVPEFEKERISELSVIDNIITWKESEDPYKVLSEHLKDLTLKRVGLESSTPFEVFLKFEHTFSGVIFEDGGQIIKKQRSIKEEPEIERIKQAASWTVSGIMDTINELHEGVTEKELAKKVIEEMSNYSNENSWALVQFAENSAIPHGAPTDRKLHNGDVILIDAGTSCDNYYADITVTITFGKPSQEFLKVYEIVEQANQKAYEAVKEGIQPQQLDRIARNVIKNKGYGEYFTHRLGHGLGLEVHEEPYIVEGNIIPLQIGNVFTDEPGIYLPNKFGVRIEDDIIVGTNKGERAIAFDRRIWE